MTHDDVISMENEAAKQATSREDLTMRFAALVAAAEHKRIMQLFKEELKKTLEETYLEGAVAGAKEEREACALLADKQLGNTNALTSYPPKSSAAWEIATAIRTRGTP